MGDLINREIADAAIQMIRCSLHGEKIKDTFFVEHDPDLLLYFCKKHSISALASLSIKECDGEWLQARLNSIRRTALFDNERKQILSLLEEKEIWYCPLKGIIIKDLYPEYGVREMSDNDILFDYTKADVVRKIMIERGYDCAVYGNWNHDSYHKEPIYNFEMHKSLFNEASDNNFSEYYTDIKNKLIKNRGDRFGFHFSDEDFYIYSVAHNHKHLSSRGSGLRGLVDMYLFLQAHPDMDRAYIDKELEKLNIFEEEKQLRMLSDKLFSVECQVLDDEEKEMLDYIISSGIYGTVSNYTKNNLNHYKNEKSLYKLRYIRDRLFLPESSLKIAFPFFYKHKWARPFLMPFRLFRILIKGRKRLRIELETIIKDKER